MRRPAGYSKLIHNAKGRRWPLLFDNYYFFGVFLLVYSLLFIASAGINVYAAAPANLKFDAARSFWKNVAPVKVDGKWGLIGVDGHLVVPAQYDDIDDRSLYQGTVIVEVAGKYGLISTAGREVLPVQYEAITDCTDNHPTHGLIAVEQGGKWGVYDRTGRVIVPTKYDEINIWANGSIGVSRAQTMGMLDERGHEMIPCTGKYDMITPADTSGKKTSLVRKDNRWGLVDRSGKELIPTVYDQVRTGDPLILVQQGKKLGFINAHGQTVIPLKYDADGCDRGNSDFSEGLAGVAASGKWGYIDEQDRTVIPFVYDHGYPFKAGLAVVERNKHAGLINKDNKIIIPLQYDELSYVVYRYHNLTLFFVDKVVIAKLNGKEGVLATDGRVMIPLKYDSVYFLGAGLFEVQIGDNYGVVDKTNTVVIPIQNSMDHINYDAGGIFTVFREGGWKFYKNNGDELISTKYDDALPFINGLAPVKMNNKWGYIDRKGKFTAWSYQ